jgi:hypothetical protein
MNVGVILFWTIAAAGTTLCGWWMAARPAALLPRIGVPVASLVLLLAVLVCLLMLSGGDVGDLVRQMRHSILG